MVKQTKSLISDELKKLSDKQKTNESGGDSTPKPKESHHPDFIDAINAIFSVMKGCYPNQYKKAFIYAEDEIHAKRVWKGFLSVYSPHIIIKSAKNCCSESSFFPNLHMIKKECDRLQDERSYQLTGIDSDEEIGGNDTEEPDNQ